MYIIYFVQAASTGSSPCPSSSEQEKSPNPPKPLPVQTSLELNDEEDVIAADMSKYDSPLADLDREYLSRHDNIKNYNTGNTTLQIT